MKIPLFDKQPIILLGMHRSGTSLIAEIITNNGVFLGNDLNIHFESKSFLEINDKLLNLAHSYWDTPIHFKNILDDKEAINNLLEWLKKQVNSRLFKSNFWGRKKFFKNSDQIRWGWKEPRTTIAFPLWLKLYPYAQIIFIYRNGVDVANSLVQRELKRKGKIFNKLYSARCQDISRAFQLWKEYNQTFLDYKNIIYKKNVLMLSYEDFLQEPVSNLRAFSKFLNIDIENVNSIVVNKNRAFNFKNYKMLVKFYEKVQEDPIMKYFKYDKIF